MVKEKDVVRAPEKLAYAVGDTASNLFWMFTVFFLSYFYLDVYGLEPAAFALMSLVVRFGFDLPSDFVMGIIADRTNTKWGKFRPYLLYCAAPFALIFWAMFITPDWGESANLIYAYVTYTLMMFVYTAINVPYSALLGVISPNTETRTSVSSYRFAAAQFGGFIVQGLTVYLVVYFGGGTADNITDEAHGYSMAALIFGILAAFVFVISFKYTKERVKPPKGQNTSIKRDLKDLVQNKPWVLLLIASFFFLACMGLRLGTIMFYFKYYSAENVMQITLFGKEMFFEYASMMMIMGTITALIVTAYASPLARIFGGKKKMFLLFMGASVISSMLFYFIPPEESWLMFVGHFLFCATTGPTGALMFAMYADTADYSEYKTGRRATGLIFSAVSAAQKGGNTIAWSLTGAVLAIVGYEKDTLITASQIDAINWLMSILPAIAGLITVAIVFFYPLTDKKMFEIEEALVTRREKFESENVSE